MTNNKFIKQNLIAIGALLALTVAILIASRFEVCAEWMTRHIYFEWARGINYISSVIPYFSFEVEAFIVVAIIVSLLIYMIVQFVHKNKRVGWTIFTSIILIVMIIAFSYCLIVTPIYNRSVLDIKEEEELISNDEVISIANKYYDDFNYVASLQQINDDGITICPYSDQELEEIIKEEYKRLTSDYFAQIDVEPKRVVSSYLMSANSIAGITYMPNVEPAYNTQMLSLDKVLTIAHEIAHTQGVMREADANEVAYYILLTSNNNYLRYVGYLETMVYINRACILANSPKSKLDIPECAIKDRLAIQEFWQEKAVLAKAGDAINDLYLKMNSQEGTVSYYSYEVYEKETIIDEDGNEVII